MQERVQVVRVRALEPVEEHPGLAARWRGEDLETGLRSTVTADLTADNYDATVGQDKS